MRFNKFDEVAMWYEKVKPIVSKNCTRYDDVRPIGERRRKWERVIRVHENKYVLSDGNYGFMGWGGTRNPDTVKYSQDMGPIVWERRQDGDYITITNHSVRSTSVTRYNFLYMHLPSAMRFHYNQSGKHFVRVGAEEYFLPKSNVRVQYTNGHNFGEVVGEIQHLEFRVEPDGKFTRVGKPAVYISTCIDKDLKKQFKPVLDKVFTDCQLYAPMFDLSWHGMQTYKKQIGESDLGKTHNLSGWWRVREIPVAFTREVLAANDNELYAPLLAAICHEIGIKHDADNTRATFNKLMNKMLGFYKLEEN